MSSRFMTAILPQLSLSIRFTPNEIELNPESSTYAQQLETVEKWKALWSKARFREGYFTKLYNSPNPHKPLIREDVAFGDSLLVQESIRYSREIDDAYVQRYWHRWSEQKPVRTAFTHFHEDARRLISAVETGLPVMVYDDQGGTPMAHFNDPADPNYTSDFIVWLGSTHNRPHKLNVIPKNGSEKIADAYWKMPVFINYANRFVASCATAALPHALMVMKKHGHKKVFVKAIQAKRGFWTVDIRDVYTLQDAHMKIAEVVGEEWVLPPHGDGKNFANSTFMIQPFVEMKNECRVFVVDGKVVAGVPVRRADSVYDAQGDGIFDIRKCHSHDNHPAIVDRELMKKYEAFAHKVADKCELTEYVMDIAENQFGQPILIEFNELSRAGLYSCDPERIMWPLIEAQLRAIDKFMESSLRKNYLASSETVKEAEDFFASELYKDQDTKVKVKNLAKFVFDQMEKQRTINQLISNKRRHFGMEDSIHSEMASRSLDSLILDLSDKDHDLILDLSDKDHDLILDLSDKDHDLILDLSDKDHNLILDLSDKEPLTVEALASWKLDRDLSAPITESDKVVETTKAVKLELPIVFQEFSEGSLV